MLKSWFSRCIKTLFRQHWRTEVQELRNRIEVLEQCLSAQNTSVNMIKSKYRDNIWALKRYAASLPYGEERSVHERAFDSFCSEYGAWIGIDSKFKSPPIFPHSLHGIFISGGAEIGNDVVIFQHVTIGSNTLSDSKGKGAPIIGDNVYIGAGAKIIGNVRVGNNCRLGANVVVTTDVPDNSVVVLEKPRIIHKENMDNKFYTTINGVRGYRHNGKFTPL